MIIRSMSRKQRGAFRRLVNYFMKEKSKTAGRGYNLFSDPEMADDVVREFCSNYDSFHGKRENGVTAYHEIIAPAEPLTEEQLYDLAEEYMKNRAPNSQGYFQVHQKSHGVDRPHVHIMISGNRIGQSKQSSIKREEFRRVKERMIEYGRERHGLVCSFELSPMNDKFSNKSRQSKAVQIELDAERTGRKLNKHEINRLVQETLESSFSEEDFKRKLKEQNIETYSDKNSKSRAGVIYEGKKYRFKTLGIDLDQCREEWQLEPWRLRELRRMRKIQEEKERERQKERGE